MKIGYARVSSIGQSLAVQEAKLAHCEKIYKEKASASGGKRPIFDACMDFVREGDVLYVTRIDRLARSTLDLCRIAAKLEEKKVALHVIDQNIETASATGRLLYHVLAAIAQFETELRAERQADGIAKAKERGVHCGRARALTEAQAQTMRTKRKSGMLIRELMEEYKLSKASVYRYLKDPESKDE